MRAPAARHDAQAIGPQAPERGRLARILGPFHVTGVFWYRFHLWGVSHAPGWLIQIAVKVFTLFFFLTLRRIRRAISSNLVPVLGRAGFLETERRIWRTMHAFAWCLTERYEQFTAARTPDVEIDNSEAWEAVTRSGEGFIVLTAHIGCWEVAASALSKQLARPVHLVREEEVAPQAQRFLTELLQRRSGGTFVTHFAGDPLLGMTLREALERGEIAALQGDRPRAAGQTIRVTAFDRELALPVGPLVLARLTGAPLLLAFAFREGRWRYRIAFREPVRVPATGDRVRDLAEAAQAVACGFEWAIRHSPFQWFCFREAWIEKRRDRSEAGLVRQSEPVRIDSSPRSSSPAASETTNS